MFSLISSYTTLFLSRKHQSYYKLSLKQQQQQQQQQTMVLHDSIQVYNIFTEASSEVQSPFSLLAKLFFVAYIGVRYQL